MRDILTCRMLSAAMFLSSFFFLMIRRPPRSTPIKSSAASDVYKRQPTGAAGLAAGVGGQALSPID